MALKDRLDDERIGREARNAQNVRAGTASAVDREMMRRESEQRGLEQRMAEDQTRARQAFTAGRDSERMNAMNQGMVSVDAAGQMADDAEVAGQEQGAVMQEQDTMRQAEGQAMVKQIVSDIDNAAAQGATPQQIQEMVKGIPQELQGAVQQVQQERALQRSNQGGQNLSPQEKPPNQITEYAKNLLAEG